MNWPAPGMPLHPALRVAVAAHDVRFVAPLRAPLRAAGCIIRDDPWQGHRRHRVEWSRALAGWADLVFAEWCLGNAVWHSTHVPDDTRLLVRLHRFEIETEYPANVRAERADAIVFVSPHIRDAAVERFGLPRERCVVIPNAVDVASLRRPKRPEARFTLGLLTWHRTLKRLDLALDVLEQVRRSEPRARLRVKGHHPSQIGFVWKSDDERAWFGEQFDRIATSPLLRDAVEFDAHGADVADWLTGVGHILSQSDVESFHLALVEGMASGAAPVIRDRWGARDLFGDAWVVEDTGDAARVVLERMDAGLDDVGRAASAFVERHYDRSIVEPAWVQLVTGRRDVAP